MYFEFINDREWRDLKWYARLAYNMPHKYGEIVYNYANLYEYRHFGDKLRIIVDYMMSLGSHDEPIDEQLADIGDALLNYASDSVWLGRPTSEALPHLRGCLHRFEPY